MKISDPAMLEATAFIQDCHEYLGKLAPPKGGREEQHALVILASYIRNKALDKLEEPDA